MNCPICNQVVEIHAVDCRECGEPLTIWRTLQASSAQIRQRGLHQAAQQNYLGATISFLEAAFSNPLECDAWLDAARALVQLGQVDDAVRLLESVRRRAPQSHAPALIAAIRQWTQEKAEQQPPATADTSPEPMEPLANSAVAENPTPQADVTGAEGRTSTGSVESSANPATDVGVSSSTDADLQLRPLQGLPPLVRKRSFFQRLSGGSSDSLWESVLAVETNSNAGPIGANGWLGHLAQHDAPHGAVLYLQGLDGWQKNDSAGALKWFVKTVQIGTPYLNPVGYILCCSTSGTQELSTCLRQLREFGIQPEEIRQVVQELKKRSGTNLPAESAEHLQRIEQINTSIN